MIKSCNSTLLNMINDLTEQACESVFALFPHADTEGSVLQTKHELSPDNEFVATWPLAFPASKTVSNKYLCIKYPLKYFVIAAETN